MRAWVLALTLVAVAGCSAEEAAAPTATVTPAPATASPARYETLDEIAAAFDCDDLQDIGTGGNPGLTSFGICRIGVDNFDIYMTSNRGQWEHIADQFPSVLGPDWIVVCPTGPKAARLVHERLGGELRIPTKSD